MSATLSIATAQCLISADTRVNGQQVRAVMTKASEGGARLVHFPEGMLSGYCKAQIKAWDTFDWSALREELEATAAHAAKLNLWTVLGSCHRLTSPTRPHNSLYVISGEGVLAGRYDKRKLSNTEINDWYTPGTDPAVFEVDGFRFGCALCIEIHFPELFMEYERLGVDCVLFSAYAEDPIFGIVAQAHAAINTMWLSLCTPTQCSHKLSSGLIGPDGYYLASATLGETSLVISQLDRADPRYEVALRKARPWRASARLGDIYHSREVDDARSKDRLSF
jgi:predicted amidohydrolase